MSVEAIAECGDAEPILEPALPIVDAHHHLWYQTEAAIAALQTRDSITARSLAQTFCRYPKYLFDEFRVDLESGHNICATVYNEAGAMYRASGPPELRSVGEIEFVNGIAAMSASGNFGQVAICAGIVGGVDLRMGEDVERVLHAHIQAGGGRYRGIRTSALYDEDPRIFGSGIGIPQLLKDDGFRAGFKYLQRLGLSFDALLLEPQLPELIDLARKFPDTQIVLNHVGGPVGVARYAGTWSERFFLWRERMRDLATCENVAVKLGGLGNPFGGFNSVSGTAQVTSEQLAQEWRPHIEAAIDLFGANRCMFESNFPVDSVVGSYAVVWNAFKRIVTGASQTEKNALFHRTAMRIYRLDIPQPRLSETE